MSLRCPRCGKSVSKKAVPTYARWCKAASECTGLRAPDTVPLDRADP